MKTLVKEVAETFLKQNFREETRSVLSDPSKWNKWIDLMHIRANEVELYLLAKGHNVTKEMLERHIQLGLVAYAQAQLKEYANPTAELNNKIKNTVLNDL